MSDLFRPEVVERQTNRLHGEILVLPRFSHGLILGLLTFWVVVVVIWLTVSTYARKETVLGWLEPPEGVVRVYPEGQGVVTTVFVNEGDIVVEGQPLIVISVDRTLSNGEGLAQRLLEEYETQKRLIEEQIASTSRLHAGRRVDIEKRLSAAREDLILLNQQSVLIDQRLTLMQENVQRNSNLRSRGYISQSDLDTLRNQELGLRNERQILSREQTSRSAQVEQLEIELNLFPEESANELAQLQARFSDLLQRVTQLQVEQTRVLKAPRAGQVNNLQTRVGADVQVVGNVPLLTILPLGAQLAANILVPVRSVGFVAPGQRLDIRYDAYPYQKFGLYSGEIIQVSDSILLPGELPNVPLNVEEPVYRITARLDRPTAFAYGQEISLKPGMTLSADIRLGERSLLQWLLEPLYSLKGRI